MLTAVIDSLRTDASATDGAEDRSGTGVRRSIAMEMVSFRLGAGTLPLRNPSSKTFLPTRSLRSVRQVQLRICLAWDHRPSSIGPQAKLYRTTG